MRSPKSRGRHETTKNEEGSKSSVFHLREGINSGQASASVAHLFQDIRNSDGHLSSLRGCANIHQKSVTPIRIGKNIGFSKATSIVELSEKSEKMLSMRGLTNSTSGVAGKSGSASPRLAVEFSAISKLNVHSVRVSSSHKKWNRFLQPNSYPNNQSTPFLNVERLHLFQALLKEPLTFLVVRERFNVSKQTIRRLVQKKGLDWPLEYRSTCKKRLYFLCEELTLADCTFSFDIAENSTPGRGETPPDFLATPNVELLNPCIVSIFSDGSPSPAIDVVLVLENPMFFPIRMGAIDF